MNIIINPGSGPVDDATEANAHAAIRQFTSDLRARGIAVVDMRQPDLDGEGRYGFALTSEALPNGTAIEVEMPGLPVDRVRYMDEDGQNIWDFPRLYVDGSSWVWKFALGVVVDTVRDGAE